MPIANVFKRRRFPSTETGLREAPLLKEWWYYTVELLPGVVAQGIYPDDMPLLPRLLMRDCQLSGMDCLDIGSMEGLIPTLMKRAGAKRVVATDAVDHCAAKLAAVKHYYDVDFEFRQVGLLYDLAKQFSAESFDLINLSGVLYHVFSPLMVLCGVRPLLRRDALLIVATNVLVDDSFSAEFNNAGRLQSETNTFWYVSVNALDYMLRYLKLAPLACRYLPHQDIHSTTIRYVTDKPTGYLGVICRAADDILPTREDAWMRNSMNNSWEHRGLCDWERSKKQPRSDIAADFGDKAHFRDDVPSLDILRAIREQPAIGRSEALAHSNVLHLSDRH